MIKFETSNAKITQEEIDAYQGEVNKLHEELINKTGAGNDFLGWVDWCKTYPKDEFETIKTSATYIRENCDVLLVCGIGGSYLGSRAAVEMINGLYADKKPELIFCGNTFSSTYTKQILDYIKDKEVCLNVISKSGTTTETALAFRLFKHFMEAKYGIDEAKKRIFATTDGNRGTLHDIAKSEGYQLFVIPDNIGGRFSVITPVGLLPIAAAGIDIDAIMKGLDDAFEDYATADLHANPAYAYAVCRRILEKRGKVAEMFVSYDLQTTMYAEWWKQLFGESEGKNGKGILPYSGTFSTDLHSLGQFVQEGNKVLFETLVKFEKPNEDIIFPSDDANLDGMNYLAGKSVDWVNKMAMAGTLDAHANTGGVPVLEVSAPDMSAHTFGYLCYFFFRAIAMTTYMIGENPFNQPGVEVYKKNMFKLLGKN